MGILRNRRSGTRYRLGWLSSVGRRDTCDIQVMTPYSSNHHAELRWTGGNWELRDMGSSNGTFLGKRRLAANERIALPVSSLVAFGDPDDPFELIDDGPPSAWATRVGADDDDYVLNAEDGMLELPGPDNPLYQIFQDGEGIWQVASSRGTRPLPNEELLKVGGHAWTVRIPRPSQQTLQRNDDRVTLRDITTRFREMAADRVEIELLRNGVVFCDMGHRNHHELLLRLAEEHLADLSNPAVAEEDHGWVYVDELIERLGLHKQSQKPRNLIDQYVSRARKAFLKAGIADAGNVITRRVTASEGQLRLNAGQLELVG